MSKLELCTEHNNKHYAPCDGDNSEELDQTKIRKIYTITLSVKAFDRQEALNEIGYRLNTHHSEGSIEEHGVKIIEVKVTDEDGNSIDI